MGEIQRKQEQPGNEGKTALSYQITPKQYQ